MGPKSVTEEQVNSILDNSDIEVSRMGKKTTVVLVTLPSGFELVASSACVDPAMYDLEVGKEICLKRIKDQIWLLEGYKLQWLNTPVEFKDD